MKHLNQLATKQISLAAFRRDLLHWYGIHRRSLPWRDNPDPYRVWLSEIILQQTQVRQGLGYFQRITARWPTVADLASATEPEILKMWQGLGYYSRARNALRAAQKVVSDHRGVFPADYHALLKLPGIGKYTAAAIASIAFQLPHAVLDGNVMRVLSRLLSSRSDIALTWVQKALQDEAQKLLDPENPGAFNQGMMELGATVCTPAKPDCSICPVSQHCGALALDKTSELPVKSPKAQVRDRFIYYWVIRAKGQPDALYMQRRTDRIWQGLYDFPGTWFEKDPGPEKALSLLGETGFQTAGVSVRAAGETTHLLTHRRLHIHFFRINTPLPFGSDQNFVLVNPDNFHDFAYPQPIALWLEKAFAEQR